MSKEQLRLDGHFLYYENGSYLGEVFALDDGFYHFWPDPKTRGGAWSANILRAIVELLDEKNKAWEEELARELGKIGVEKEQEVGK